MNKVLMFGLILVLILGVLIGCSGNEEEVAESVRETPAPTGDIQVTRELELMVNLFRSAGLEIGQYHEKNYEIIGATAGMGLEIEGGDIELYYYDPDKADSDIIEVFMSF